MVNFLTSWQDKNALITGASSGIGAAIAEFLAQKGLRVILVARRLEKLKGLAGKILLSGGRADILESDLSREEQRQAVYQKVHREFGSVDVLVNNAGLGWYGYFSQMPWETALNLLHVNITAAMHLTRLFLPDMLARNRGHIINIGSISGSLPSQGVAVYGASKSFLDSFSTALHREMHGTQVRISVIRAGPVQSEFFETSAKRSAGLRIPVERFAIPATQVAEETWKLLLKPKRVIYVPQILRITPWFELFFGWLIDRLGPLLLRRQLATKQKRD